MKEYAAFNTLSNPELLKLAYQYRFQMAAVNDPAKYLHMSGALPRTSECAVTAKGGDLRINFFSKTARHYMQSEVSVAEALIDEGLRRVKFERHFSMHTQLFESLREETEKFVNSVIAEQGPVFVTGWKPKISSIVPKAP